MMGTFLPLQMSSIYITNQSPKKVSRLNYKKSSIAAKCIYENASGLYYKPLHGKMSKIFQGFFSAVKNVCN